MNMNKDLKKVIIIISNYNGVINRYKNKPLLHWPLNSLKKTKYKDYKIILADDCSTDNSIEYVKKNFSYVEITKNKVNGGYSKNNNNAIKYAMQKYKPDYILLLNNDIIITEKNWLGELVKVAESNRNIGLVGCKLIYPNNRIQHAGIILRHGIGYNKGRGEKNRGQYNSIEEMEGVTFACVLISKKVINKIGLLDENFVMGSEDIDYNIRVKKAGFEILYDGNVKLIHLEGYTSTYIKNTKFKEKQFYNEQRNRVYFTYKYYRGLQKIKLLLLIILISFISIEGQNRKRNLFSIRFKDKIFKRFKLSINAINDGRKLYKFPISKYGNLGNKMKNYDIVFVLPSVSIGYPPGGYDVVYRLANGLNKNNIKTAIIFISQISNDLYIPNYVKSNFKKTNILLYKIFKFTFYDKKLSWFYHHLKILNKLFNIDYDYDLLKNVDCYFYEKADDIKLNTNIMFATAWETAYFVNRYAKNNLKLKLFYLVSHNEDDPSFSGQNSNNARETYNFKFKKVVINQKVYNRFKNDRPLFFHVGIDTKFYKQTIKFKYKNNVLFPLRKNESKGAKYAIECIKKLIDSVDNLKLSAFGDLKKEELPISIKNKIDYYYNPTRNQLRLLYNKSKIFVLPSLVEGFALPPLEAMLCGSAVIVTNNGGINEYIKNNINGLICPIKDSNCLYKKIVYLLNNKNNLYTIAKKGQKTAIKYSYEKMVNSFIDIIQTNL